MWGQKLHAPPRRKIGRDAPRRRCRPTIEDDYRHDANGLPQSHPSGQPSLAPRHQGHYADFNLTSALDRGRLDDEKHVRMTVWSATGMAKPTFVEGVAGLGSDLARTYQKGDWLGPSWTNHWVHVVLNIPEAFRKSGEPVIFEFDPGCEGLIYNMEGHPLHAITGGANSRKDGAPGTAEDRRIDHIVPREAVTAGRYEIYIEVSVNGLFGVGINGFRHQRPDMNVSFKLASADLVLARSEARALQIDFKVLAQLARAEEGERWAVSRRALRAANEVMNAFRRSKGDGVTGELDLVVSRCREIARSVLGHIDKGVTSKPSRAAMIWGIGHCHIDTAWLWRYTQSQQKVARSWSSQVDLIARYPKHHFGASSAQQYAWLEEL
ncbi:Glycoside hydrolase, 38 vacuolar alpha mannosidase [Saitozyma podzolica]|uniref:Glycoside hydrolase, 38 vacuolar alpha mannosidase n=1 Tax=Saitozyma podzolica TaxID=1890683 RepID=A0A427YSV6_9TREE|nr:Glycoside hydrolase, 38 vacuolar alpha mannosidase [Saitozyma podzolica]